MDALASLRLQIEWGADEALLNAPLDRLRPQTAAILSRQEGGNEKSSARETQKPLASLFRLPGGREGKASASGLPPSTAPASVASVSAVERAIATAGQAETIAELRAAVAAFEGCSLRDTAANLVFVARGPVGAPMLIGDPPSDAEDRGGTPFAGLDGALLDRMLAAIGLTRAALWLTPLLPWRPPGGRPPSPAELAICLPFLHRLIALSAPPRLVVAGGLATRVLTGAAPRRAASGWTDVAIPNMPHPIPCLTMPGPAAVARRPQARREAWAALRLLRGAIDAEITSK